MKASFSSKIKFNKDLRKQYFSLLLINQFSTKGPLPYPLKISEMFSGGIEVEHWLKMD